MQGDESPSNGSVKSRRLRRGLLLAGAGAAALGAVVAGVLVARDGGSAAPVAAGVQVAGGRGELEAKPGRPAPVLSGTSPITGERVSLSDFRGKPVVINVWASWCAPCAAEAPDIKRFVAAHPEAVMLGIDFQDSGGGARGFYREFSWTHPSISDPSGKLAAKLGVAGLPTTIFLDAQHREVARILGETDFAALERGLRLATSTG